MGILKKKILQMLNESTKEDMLSLAQKNNREILLEEITPQVACKVSSLIRFWNLTDTYESATFSEREPVKIFINSRGGDLAAAMSIMDAIKMSHTPVITINVGTVYKESLCIYLMGTKRVAYPNSSFMFYRTLEFNLPILKESESTFYNCSSLYKIQLETLKKQFLEITKITETQYDKHCRSDWWFSADEAMKLKICNTIVSNHIDY